MSPKKTPIIFLDVDGVLNSQVFFFKRKYLREKRERLGHYEFNLEEHDPANEIDPYKVSLLNKIVEATDAKVVVSSTWRRLYSLENLRSFLFQKGFCGEIIGITPTKYENYRAQREKEIFAWLKKHNKKGKHNSFVVLDDQLFNIDKEFPDNFVRTDAKFGLTLKLTKQAINILTLAKT